MKILFSMPHPGFVRHFESTVAALVSRGHQVLFAFANNDSLGRSVALDRLLEGSGAVAARQLEHDRQGPWFALSQGVRRVADYQRYFDERYDEAPRLRQRASVGIPPRVVRAVNALPLRREWARRGLRYGLAGVEMAIPLERVVHDLFDDVRPDLVLVTPFLEFGSYQTEFVKAARLRGIPSAVCVFSWDNLTNKGSFRLHPDWVTVWNEFQRREAVEIHGLSENRVIVVGAACFDHWFERRPQMTRGAFFSATGLNQPDGLLLLYTCSSHFIGGNELPFVRRWITELRRSSDPSLRAASVLVRPHPNNLDAWKTADLSDLGHVAVWPIDGSFPVDEESRAKFFDSVFHSAAVVGLNTTAQIEAAIVGRPVLTVRDSTYVETQGGTLHFKHLTDSGGGLVHVADSLLDHVAQLQRVLGTPTDSERRSRDFVAAFLRPHGVERPATPFLVEAVERMPASRTAIDHRVAMAATFLRPLFKPVSRIAARVARARR